MLFGLFPTRQVKGQLPHSPLRKLCSFKALHFGANNKTFALLFKVELILFPCFAEGKIVICSPIFTAAGVKCRIMAALQYISSYHPVIAFIFCGINKMYMCKLGITGFGKHNIQASFEKCKPCNAHRRILLHDLKKFCFIHGRFYPCL